MSFSDRYVVCRNRRIVQDRFILRGSAQRMADEMNGIAGRPLYHVHQESELDAAGCGPCPDTLHARALPTLQASAIDNPRLAALLSEIRKGEGQA